MQPPSVSIIICTRNRAEDLRQTLSAIARVDRSPAFASELLIIDNGSADDTEQVIRASQQAGLASRYLFEPHPGLSHARNRALAEAKGSVLLFADDDIRPSAAWISGMCEPIFSGKADAVVGVVKLAPYLNRPWMTHIHRAWLAETMPPDGDTPSLVGANMAFARAVCERVPGFELALGAGALGFGEETLFGRQLVRAGFRIARATDVVVEHHCSAARLSRSNFLQAAHKHGRLAAWMAHHWEHEKVDIGLKRLWKRRARLLLERVKKCREIRSKEGAPLWELLLVQEIAFVKYYRSIVHLPRKYERFGLAAREA